MKSHQELKLREELVAVSRYFHSKGWSLASSSNYSCKLGDNKVLITKSGKDKSALQMNDLMTVDLSGKALEPEGARASAETLLHCQVYQVESEISCVLHTHSKFVTALSINSSLDRVVLKGYEMLKALPIVSTHDVSVVIPIVNNSQDMNQLIEELNEHPGKQGMVAYIIRGHGLYTWGSSVLQTKLQAEAIEFLIECEYLRGKF